MKKISMESVMEFSKARGLAMVGGAVGYMVPADEWKRHQAIREFARLHRNLAHMDYRARATYMRTEPWTMVGVAAGADAGELAAIADSLDQLALGELHAEFVAGLGDQ